MTFPHPQSGIDTTAIGIAQIAKDTKLTPQTIYRIKDDPAGAEAALSAWGCSAMMEVGALRSEVRALAAPANE